MRLLSISLFVILAVTFSSFAGGKCCPVKDGKQICCAVDGKCICDTSCTCKDAAGNCTCKDNCKCNGASCSKKCDKSVDCKKACGDNCKSAKGDHAGKCKSRCKVNWLHESLFHPDCSGWNNSCYLTVPITPQLRMIPVRGTILNTFIAVTAIRYLFSSLMYLSLFFRRIYLWPLF